MKIHSGGRSFAISAAITVLLIFACLIAVGSFTKSPHAQDARLSTSSTAKAATVQSTRQAITLRVGFPLQQGMSFYSNKERTGYTYEYLREISQQTGWTYEFTDGDKLKSVEEQMPGLVNLLIQGKIDLLGGVPYREELAEKVRYCAAGYGSYNRLFFAARSNDSVNEEFLFHSKEPVKIAVQSGSSFNDSKQAILRFFGGDESRFELTALSSAEDLIAAVRKNKGQVGYADVFLGTDASLPKASDTLKTVASFMPEPYYFIFPKSEKGNTLADSASVAVSNLSLMAPSLAGTLYQRYFITPFSRLTFTQREEEYIRSAPVLKVAFAPFKAPVQYVKNGVAAGISCEIFERIAQSSGLKFEYVPTNSQTDLRERLNAGAVDIAAGIPYNYENAEDYNVALTRPYLTSQMVTVINSAVDPSQLSDKVIALPYGVKEESGTAPDVLRFDEIPQCLDAVNKGKADYTYGNGYSVQYYLNEGAYKNIYVIPQSVYLQDMAFGVVRPADESLIGILNKCLFSIPKDEMQGIIYQNSAYEQEKFGFIAFINAHAVPVTVVLTVSLLAIVAATVLIIFFQYRARTVGRLEYERYRQLCDITGEYLFEYDYGKDRLILSDKSSVMLGVAKERFHYRANLEKDGVEGELEFFNRILSDKKGSVELNCVLNDGSSRWLRVTAKQIVSKKGKPLFTIGKVIDIQAQKEEQYRLYEKSQRDGLTELYNAATCRKRVTDALVRAPEGGGLLIIFDIDRFKEVNDNFGHFTGDRVLIETGRNLNEAFLNSALLGRVGGDEFLIFVENPVSLSEIKRAFDTFAENMKKIYSDAMPKGTITVSAGAVLARMRESYDDLYKRADRALYSVKENGRNAIAKEGFEWNA